MNTLNSKSAAHFAGTCRVKGRNWPVFINTQMNEKEPLAKGRPPLLTTLAFMYDCGSRRYRPRLRASETRGLLLSLFLSNEVEQTRPFASH